MKITQGYWKLAIAMYDKDGNIVEESKAGFVPQDGGRMYMAEDETGRCGIGWSIPDAVEAYMNYDEGTGRCIVKM